MQTFNTKCGVEFRVDDVDAPLVSQFDWYYSGGNTKYIKTIIRFKGKICNLYLHRMVAPPPQGYDVDHIDGDPLNNTRDNLRLCGRSHNNASRSRS